ncbi:MAG: hypothetical protein P1Q69_20545, partial [Candidatus Thorarchaeota archaeon]|nr:hypothetical protein [Candidatus Thorarchaeota archaeon]
DLFMDIASAGYFAYKVVSALNENYTAVNKVITIKGEDAGTAIGMAQKGITALAVGFQFVVKTGIEMKHAQW